MHFLRRTASGVVTALAGGMLAVLPALPAYAEEIYPRPSDGVFHIDGHGWGHGRGLNQWGAQGAAKSGVAWTKIVETYYPGTTSLTLTDKPIRVLVEEDDGRDVRVKPASGLAVADLATGGRWTLPSGYTDFRVTRDSAGMHVSGYASGWRTLSFGGRTTFTGPMQFDGATFVRLYLPDGTMRDYRGAMRAVASGGGIEPVNHVPMESYLRGVVPRESPASFHAEALKAQSVAARSYSAYKRDHAPSGSLWDICSTITCQVYGGARLVSGSTTVTLEHANTNAAIEATKGVVRAYGGKAIFAEFSSSNGGHSTASTTFSYLRAQPDPWDELASPHHNWVAQVTAAQIEARYPSVGKLTRIRVISRDGYGDWGGRVKSVILDGVDSAGRATSVQSTGAGIYNANPWPRNSNGLRGSWWKIRPTTGSAFSGVVVGMAKDVRVRPAGTSAAWFDLKNTGNLEWPVDGAVRSGLREGTGSHDPSSWITESRPGPLTSNRSRPGATTVKPGEVGRFAFTLAGNGRAEGSYTEVLSVVWETKYWMDLTIRLPFRVQLLFAGDLVATAPSVVIPGHGSGDAWFDVKNTGDMAWPLTSPINSVTIGMSPSRDASWRSSTRPARIGSNVTRPGATEVAVGEVARFPFRLAGNGRAPGAYSEKFGMVWEGRAQASLRVPLGYTVKNVFTGAIAAKPAVVHIATGGHGLVHVDVKNTGNMTWPVRGAARVSAPSTSPSRSSRWITPTRPGAIIGNVTRPGTSAVAPGETARFAWWLAANGRPAGTKATETFGFVFEGVGSLNVSAPIAYEVRNKLAAKLVSVRPSPLYLPVRDALAVQVDVRNEGWHAWPVGGLVRVTMPATSPSKAPGWLGSSRPSTVVANVTRPGTSSIGPGEVARFVVPLSGNGRRSGTAATEYLGLVWEGSYTFPIRIPLKYTVKDVYTGRVATLAVPATVPSAGTGRVRIDVVNTGNIAWPVGGEVKSVMESAARAPGWVSATRPSRVTANATTPGATVVKPGETARFEFDLAGNGRAPGEYSHLVRFVWEMRAWIGVTATVSYRIV